MKKVLIIVLIVGLILIGPIIYLTSHHKSPAAKVATSNMNTSSNSSSNQTATAASSVVINNFAFSPAAITVKAGTKVTWKNNDSTTHTVTENDSQAGPASGNLAPGSSYSFTYTTAGTFKYHCSIHPDMTGTVTVTE